MHRRLLLTIGAALAAGLTGVLVLVGPGGLPRRDVPASVEQEAARADAIPAASAGGREDPAVRVLHQWDRRRSAAYARGSVESLRSLYVAGSGAGRADVLLLRGYLGRGYRVIGMRMQLLDVGVLARGPRRIRLRVTDRLDGAVAVGPSGRLELPRDQASTRVVELRRRGRVWRVAGVTDPSLR